MKKIILILCILLLSGCTTEYNLEIKGNSFSETIDVVIDKNEIPKKEYLEEDIELDDPITPFLEEDNSVFFTRDDIYYDKIVQEYDNYYKVNMKYTYIDKEFSNSNTLNLCFDKFDFKDEENYYIRAYGNFYCLYSNEVSINIKTNNSVIRNNADKVKGNVYTWYINNENVNDVDIIFEISKKNNYSYIVKYLFIIMVPVLIIGAAIYIYNNKKKNNSI